MVNVWIVEALKHVSSKLLEFFHRKVESLHEFVILYLLDVRTDNRIVKSITNDVDAREISHRRENSVRTIEESNLTLVVWSLRLSDENVETSLVSREFLTQFLASHVFSLLDYPKVEDFSLNDEIVLVTDLVLDFHDVLAWETWYDTVNESSANVVVFLKPLRESLCLLTEVRSPELDVLADAVLEVVTIEEDELTRHDDETLSRITVECVETVPEELSELARIRSGRSVGELA